MQEIHPDVLHINVTNQPTGKHHIILVTKGEMFAESLAYQMGDKITLSYLYDSDNSFYYLVVESTKDIFFKITIIVTGQTTNWLEYIDANLFTDLWFGYLDKSGSVLLYGQSVPL